MKKLIVSKNEENEVLLKDLVENTRIVAFQKGKGIYVLTRIEADGSFEYGFIDVCYGNDLMQITKSSLLYSDSGHNLSIKCADSAGEKIFVLSLSEYRMLFNDVKLG